MQFHRTPYDHWTDQVLRPEEAAAATVPDPSSAMWRGNVELDREQTPGRRVRPRPWCSLQRLPTQTVAIWQRAATKAESAVVNGGIDDSYAGAFCVRPGHCSDVHVDRNNGERKFVFILFLNEVRGGELELRSDETQKLIAPTPGLLVVLPLTATSWHGVREVKKGNRLTLGGHLYHEDLVTDVVRSAWWVDENAADPADAIGP